MAVVPLAPPRTVRSPLLCTNLGVFSVNFLEYGCMLARGLSFPPQSLFNSRETKDECAVVCRCDVCVTVVIGNQTTAPARTSYRAPTITGLAVVVSASSTPVNDSLVLSSLPSSGGATLVLYGDFFGGADVAVPRTLSGVGIGGGGARVTVQTSSCTVTVSNTVLACVLPPGVGSSYVWTVSCYIHLKCGLDCAWSLHVLRRWLFPWLRWFCCWPKVAGQISGRLSLVLCFLCRLRFVADVVVVVIAIIVVRWLLRASRPTLRRSKPPLVRLLSRTLRAQPHRCCLGHPDTTLAMCFKTATVLCPLLVAAPSQSGATTLGLTRRRLW